MAKELRHKDTGVSLTRTLDNALDRHYMIDGVANDMLIYDATNAKLIGKTPTEILALMTTSTTVELNYVDGVTSAIQTQLDAKVTKALFDAHTVLYATTDDTPAALSVTEQTLVGRITAGNIAALSTAQVRTLLSITNVEDTAHSTDAHTMTIDGIDVSAHAVANTGVHGIGASTFATAATLAAYAQPLDATLTSIALLGTAADKIAYTTNTDVWAEAAITAAGRSMVAGANAAAQLALMTTALKAELDLLDLAGLTAGQMLVATAATTAAWQSTGVVLTSPTINGTIATTELTLPAVTLSGAVTGGSQSISGLGGLSLIAGANILSTVDNNDSHIWGGTDGYSAGLYLRGKSNATEPGWFVLQTPLAGITTVTNRLQITGAVNTAVATWSAVTHTGLNITSGQALQVAGTQVVGARVVDARCDDAINSGDATTDGVIDALRDAMITHGLIAAA